MQFYSLRINLLFLVTLPPSIIIYSYYIHIELSLPIQNNDSLLISQSIMKMILYSFTTISPMYNKLKHLNNFK